MKKTLHLISLFIFISSCQLFALSRPEKEFKVFQFPHNMMPCIDGKTNDWDIVPNEYVYGIDQLNDTEDGNGTNYNRQDLDVKVRVGWVKGLNRLYFLYEAYDDFWDFARTDLTNDIFEIAVDADLSGGPFIINPQLNDIDSHFMFKGVHGQNYHIFTPPEGKEWTMVWGCQPWIAELPYANYAYNYNFKHGESGRLVLECWITPFDYAPYDGPSRAVISQLIEKNIIGLSWSILEYDGKGKREGHWNLAHNVEMVKNGSYLCAFRLMPLEGRFRKPIEALWSFKVVNMDRRLVAFKDQSYGKITNWLWDFGDGATSTEQNPIHMYQKPGVYYVVVLYIEGPDGKARFSRVWDVAIK